jgi:O-antigen/teichoic acid export membrane protein
MYERLRARFPSLANAAYATLTAGSAALLLVLLMIAARFLSADDYGRFAWAFALTTIIETVMDAGLGQLSVRATGRDKDWADGAFGHVLGLKLVWVVVGLTILVIVTPILKSDPRIIKLCYLMGISSAVRSYLLTARGVLQGLGRFDLEALAVVSDRVLLLAAGTAALWFGYGLFGLAFAFVGARLIMLAAVTILLRAVIGHVTPAFDRARWRDLQTAALPLGLFMIALNAYTLIDTVILGVMRSDAEVGWYAASYRIYDGLTYPPSIIAALLTPRLSYLFVNDRPAHRRMMMLGLAGSMTLGVVLGGIAILVAGPLVTLLFGSGYAPAAVSFRVLAGGAFLVFGTWILHAAAISTNLDRRLLLTTVVGLLSNVVLNIALIPRWGIEGAAWATVVAEGITVVLLFVQLQRRLREP